MIIIERRGDKLEVFLYKYNERQLLWLRKASSNDNNVSILIIWLDIDRFWISALTLYLKNHDECYDQRRWYESVCQTEIHLILSDISLDYKYKYS